ncbi:MAG: tRNA lysidine(34) synthetase TilS [Mariprofundaceae bacterium]|nr:tRNA lysidine(34) synthetase TilS [Mariprofundaceae bacterium]
MNNYAPVLSDAADWLEGQSLPRRLAVGYSGGADSTALLLALLTRGHEVLAWHVDHGWHADSAAQADALAARARAWGVEFHQARVKPHTARNREAEARKARFGQFALWAAGQGVDTLCLAQQRDDQSETVCMRMLQGAGVAGCCGMRQRRDWQGLHIIRPLLHVGRQELSRALRDAGVQWYEDASNRDTTLLRNRIRHQFFPAMRRNGIEPDELFGRWQKQASRLSERLNREADVVPIHVSKSGIELSWESWQQSSRAVRAVLLQRMNARLFGEGRVLGRRHIMLAEKWREHGGHRGIDLSGCRLSRCSGRLHLAPAPVRLAPYPR